MMGVEPTRAFAHHALNVARLPVPAHRFVAMIQLYQILRSCQARKWWESNPLGLLHPYVLSRNAAGQSLHFQSTPREIRTPDTRFRRPVLFR